MPDWLQLRVTQCYLHFVHRIRTDVSSSDQAQGFERAGEQQRISACNALVPERAPSFRQLLPSLPPQCQAQSSSSNVASLRWHKPVHPAHCSTVVREPVVQDDAAASGSGVDVASIAPFRPQIANGTADASLSDLCTAAGAIDETSSAANARKPLKRPKKHRQTTSSSLLASPPKIYKDDREYQRYLADSNDVGAWVRRTLLDRS